ncbi:hypothetical protein DYB30_007362, partial [Aphanomyces astaci]
MAVEKTTQGKKATAPPRVNQPEAEETLDASNDNSAKKKPTSQSSGGGGSSWGLRFVGLAAVGAAVAFGTSNVTVDDLPVTLRSLLGQNTALPSSIPPSLFDPVGNKYASELVKISTRKLLVPDASCTAAPKVLSDLVHVDAALGHADDLRNENKVFLLLNGQNHGIFLDWSKDSGCLHALAATAATSLGADPDFFPNGLRLYNSMGHPITTAA